MTPEIAFVLAATVAALALFVSERFSSDAVALVLLIGLVAGEAIEPADAFRCIGNEAIITVAAMFVLSAGVARTGAMELVGRKVLALGGSSERRLLVVLMLAAILCSAFVNNTPVAVVFLPLVLAIAEKTGVRASRLLLPMSYATIIGGMCTVIGTSTNVLVSAQLPAHGLDPLPFFEPLPLALAGIAVSVGYMALVGHRLLPSHATVSGSSALRKDYLTEFDVPAGSPLAGKTVAELLDRAGDLRVLQVVRDEAAHPVLDTGLRLEEGDALLVKGDVNALLQVQRAGDLRLPPELGEPHADQARDVTLAELLVLPSSTAVGERVRALRLHARHGALVLAVQRHGTHIREKVADLRLHHGDMLLVQTSDRALARLRDSTDFLVVEGVEQRVIRPEKAVPALAIIGLVVLLAASGVFPVSLLALGGAVAMVGTRCLGPRAAYESIPLPLLILMAGTLALGLAMDRSGAARWIAGGIVHAAEPLGDVALLSGIYLLANVLTALLSNAAAALLTLPIALAAAAGAEPQLRPEPFVMAVMFAASIDFSTPIGYQTNMFVYGPGGYRFRDYLRVGGPLNLLWWVLATALIPVLWPLR